MTAVGGRVILRGAELVLRSERAQGAPSGTYVAQCLACRAESGLVDYDLKAAAVWTLEHTRRYGPDHWQYLVTIRRHWLVHRHRPRPAPQPVPPAAPPPPRPSRGALALAALALALLCCGYALVG